MTPAIVWEGELLLLDQRRLPHKVEWFRCRTYKDVIYAIKNMVVRGAPAIGIAGAMALALGARSLKGVPVSVFKTRFEAMAQEVKGSRPTAVNLSWAVERMVSKVRESHKEDPEELVDELEKMAREILEEDIRINKEIGELGSGLVPNRATILTHCNAGALATGGHGTALGVIRSAHQKGKEVKVIVDETRPWLQGHRLTAWELKEEGIEHYVIVDGAAGHFMAKRLVDLVIVGADRIASNGDTANKIGTYTLAVLAKANDIPFYVAAPISTIDPRLTSGMEIPVEERPEEEVLKIGKRMIGPKGTRALNPVFDVTPWEFITAIITERGILKAPYHESISKALAQRDYT